MTGLEWPHQLEITVDGERVFLAPVGGEDDNRMSDANFAAAADTIDARLKTASPVKAGPHDVGVAFIRKNSAEYGRTAAAAHTRSRSAEHERHSADRARGHHRAVTSRPARATRRAAGAFSLPSGEAPQTKTACARKILSTLARRAYRQPVSERMSTR